VTCLPFCDVKARLINRAARALAGRGHIKNCVSIEERPDIVDEKSHAGDWEID
jgi:IS30 family transposase